MVIGQSRPMICTYCYDDTQREGWVRVDTLAEAFAILGKNVTVYPLADYAEWPGDPGESVWTDAAAS